MSSMAGIVCSSILLSECLWCGKDQRIVRSCISRFRRWNRDSILVSLRYMRAQARSRQCSLSLRWRPTYPVSSTISPNPRMERGCIHGRGANVYMRLGIMTVWIGCYSKVISIKFISAFFLFRFRAFDFTLETVQFSRGPFNESLLIFRFKS